MSGWGLLLLTSLLSGLGQICQKQATQPATSRTARRHIGCWLLLALLLLSLAMLCWLQVLQRLPVGIAYPLLSLNFIWIALISRALWHENISRRQWLGIGLIIIGTLLLRGSL